MKTLLAILVYIAFGFSVTATPSRIEQGNLKVTGIQGIGPDSLLNSSVFDVNGKPTKGPVQNGITMEAQIGTSAFPANGVFIEPRIPAGVGHVPLFNCVTIMPPKIGAGSGYKRGYALYISDMTGSDSGMGGGFFSNRLVAWDSLFSMRTFISYGGINMHGALLNKSRMLNDTDYYLYFNIGSVDLNDTLPLIASNPGKRFEFVQYTGLNPVGVFTLFAHSGNKIEGYDSICMRSNLGISRMILIASGDKWVCTYRHEEGKWLAVETGVTGSVTDTGWYSMDNFLDFTVSFRALRGTSNTTTMGVTSRTGIGPYTNINFTNPLLDTNYTATAVGEGWDNGALISSVTCTLFMSGADISCENTSVSPPALFTNANSKGVRRMTTFHYHSPIPAIYR